MRVPPSHSVSCSGVTGMSSVRSTPVRMLVRVIFICLFYISRGENTVFFEKNFIRKYVGLLALWRVAPGAAALTHATPTT